MSTKRSRGRRSRVVVGLAVIAALALAAAPALADADQGYMGVYMQKLTRDIREGLDIQVDRGVLVSGVREDSPAAKAGLEDGDVIVELDGKPVSDPDGLRDLVRGRSPGDEVDVVVIREGDRRTLTVTLGEEPQTWSFDFGDHDMKWFDGDGYSVARLLGGPTLGVRASELNEDLAGYFDARAGDGILVLDVVEGSVAEAAGVKSGDVITRVNGEAIGDVDDVRDALGDLEEGDTFTVTVLRKGHTEELEATMDDQSVRTFWSGSHPRLHIDRLPRVDREDIDSVLDELREEIRELKKEVKQLKDDM